MARPRKQGSGREEWTISGPLADLTSKRVSRTRPKPPFLSPAWLLGDQVPVKCLAYLLLSRPCGFNFPHMNLLRARAEIPKDCVFKQKKIYYFQLEGYLFYLGLCVSAERDDGSGYGLGCYWVAPSGSCSSHSFPFIIDPAFNLQFQAGTENQRSELWRQGDAYTDRPWPWQPQSVPLQFYSSSVLALFRLLSPSMWPFVSPVPGNVVAERPTLVCISCNRESLRQDGPCYWLNCYLPSIHVLNRNPQNDSCGYRAFRR